MPQLTGVNTDIIDIIVSLKSISEEFEADVFDSFCPKLCLHHWHNNCFSPTTFSKCIRIFRGEEWELLICSYTRKLIQAALSDILDYSSLHKKAVENFIKLATQNRQTSLKFSIELPFYLKRSPYWL